MKQALIGVLKVVVPLGLGVWLIFYFYNALSDEHKAQLFDAFGRAELGWLLLSVLLGWMSHLSRAWRWRYLLDPMGFTPSFWNCYHAVMSGYFMNMLLPRAGEASRAALLYRREKVPFVKGFGSIMAERAVDLILLGGLFALTLLLQVEKIDLFRERVDSFRAGQGHQDGSGLPWGWILLGAMLVGGAVAGWLVITRPALHARLMDTVRGFGEGLRSVTRTRHPGGFILHTVLIWVLYVLMFAVGFLCLPATAQVPWSGILAGFVAGAIGIVLVQGGIGVYPAFVALIVSVYMPAPEGGGLLVPEALAMGWLIWVAQTLMIIVLGGVSLLLISRSKSSNE
ncbi:MAG: flippase-like domain-containing protein [Flavobacteriales bacterium]|nr:flippase-like domain-containing protein [Flavobacteriales bacterium]MCB0787645.1 flippase-like domain-containing protein [Flavobacteriales bacterium]MCB0810755.1 flippase-like domain-containing protein [Flavobacteriales bacterium]